MGWFGAESRDEFLDAERVYNLLERIAAAPNLYRSAADKFPPATRDDAFRAFDEPALELLVENELVDVTTDLRNTVERWRHLDLEGERNRRDLVDVYRRLKTLAVQIRKADRDVESGGVVRLLKSKNQRWQEKTRRGELQREADELTLRRRRMESDLEKVGGLFKDLLDTIYRDSALRDGFWLQDMPMVLTYDGRFLLEYLREMNTANFRGRTLAEIIEIGQSLA